MGYFCIESTFLEWQPSKYKKRELQYPVKKGPSCLIGSQKPSSHELEKSGKEGRRQIVLVLEPTFDDMDAPF